MKAKQRLFLSMFQNYRNHCQVMLAKQRLNDELPDIIEIDEEHQGDDDGKTYHLCALLGLVADGATNDGFDEQDKDVATVKTWDGQDIHERQCYREEGRHCPELQPLPRIWEDGAHRSETAQ